MVPATLGRTKFVKSWHIQTADDPSAPVATVTIDFSLCEEEGMVDVGTSEHYFPIHCTLDAWHRRLCHEGL